MKYFGGCDVGSTYTKAVILDENGKMCADTTIRSKINAEQSAIAAMEEVCGGLVIPAVSILNAWSNSTGVPSWTCQP